MGVNSLNRDIGVCDSGYNFYHCDNGFVGCCSVEACDLDGCPDEDQQADPTTRTTKNPTISTLTFPTETYTTDVGYYTDKSSTSSTTEPSTHTLADTTPTSRSTSSSSPFSHPTAPLSSTTPQNNIGGSPQLSTAAIAGISAGGTILGILILTVVSLLIRRRCIAKRMASLPPTAPFAEQPQEAEKFMEDHPSWRDGQQPRPLTIPQGITEEEQNEAKLRENELIIGLRAMTKGAKVTDTHPTLTPTRITHILHAYNRLYISTHRNLSTEVLATNGLDHWSNGHHFALGEVVRV
ncbi:hypothetical protein F5Y05DRAFT_419889 [Hypoxylon sp. FL0543]|nr:hypothetical protein F5Y05DRAFT_419889 [Hypoxylon sp. FL0543]